MTFNRILSLHFNYAILYTSTPVIFGREGIWAELSLGIEGRALLERGRDAAVAVIQAICSVSPSGEISLSFPDWISSAGNQPDHCVFIHALPTDPRLGSSSPWSSGSTTSIAFRLVLNACDNTDAVARHLSWHLRGDISCSTARHSDIIFGVAT
jgi:hypothetical protein